MKLIHKVEECTIYESNKHSYASVSEITTTPIKSFLLKVSSSDGSESAVSLLSSVAKLIKHACSHTMFSIKFKALRAVPLKTFIQDMHSASDTDDMFGMAYTLTLKLLADIGTQLEHIRADYGRIIPFLSLEDIVVVTQTRDQYDEEGEGEGEGEGRESNKITKVFDYVFVFMNAEKLILMQKNNKKELIIDVPLKVNKHTSFLPAELPESALKRLPMRFTTTSWYYSLSALCIYALLQHKFKNGEDNIERIGRPFLHTSLYFCLKRCLKTEPEERVLLYV